MAVEKQVTNAVYDVAEGLLQVYLEAEQTHGYEIATAGLAYAAAMVVHGLEHKPHVAGLNAPALATGVWSNAFHRFLDSFRTNCAAQRQRGLN